MEIFESLNNDHIKFIQEQKVFFVATAVADGRINLSPKGLDSLRVLNGNRIVWLNLTGSGNETAAHVQESARMTLMMNAFEGKPLILRIYGEAKAVHHLDKEWSDLISLFPYSEGSRQIFDLSISSVQTSCGWAVPEYKFIKESNSINYFFFKINLFYQPHSLWSFSICILNFRFHFIKRCRKFLC